MLQRVRMIILGLRCAALCVVFMGAGWLAGQGAEAPLTWNRVGAYVSPNYAEFFPDDEAGGRRLDEAVRSRQLEALPVGEITRLIQNGLRRCQSHRMPILRTLGNRFIWGRVPQNPSAIELMYHATSCPAEGEGQSTAQAAVYFGLSVVEPKNEHIIRALVEACVSSDDPNLLDRAVWGLSNDLGIALASLNPFLASKTATVRAKAQLVRRMLKGEVNAFAWEKQRARKFAQDHHAAEMPDIQEHLRAGTSAERREAFEKIARLRLDLIMDATFVESVGRAGADNDPKVRASAARLLGENWVWQASEQNPEAIELLMDLSRDEEVQVRRNAIYFGLSTVRSKSSAVVHRLLEGVLEDASDDMRQRVAWGVASEKELALQVLQEMTTSAPPSRAEKMAGLRSLILGDPVQTPKPAPATRPSAGNWVERARQRLQKPFKPFGLRLVGGELVVINYREQLALGAGLFVVIGSGDEVRTIDVRQIEALQDLGN